VELTTQGIDRVWIALHGPGGEDGSVQGTRLRAMHGQVTH
jgi:D-alanine-D-alanine ligase-like ATP-grasp enzyme